LIDFEGLNVPGIKSPVTRADIFRFLSRRLRDAGLDTGFLDREI
jgi:hypothetical protein